MKDELSISQAFQNLKASLSSISEVPGLEAWLILEYASGRKRSWLLAHPEVMLGSEQRNILEETLTRYQRGEALPYLLGRWEFYGLEFELTPAALIPRPETEILVEVALTWLSQNPGHRLAADVGTGSGAIGVTLAVHHPNLRVMAGERSWLAALAAQRNVAKHQVADRVFVVNMDLLAALGQPVDLLCANLPYIPSARLDHLDVAHREPLSALDGGVDGLQVIRQCIAQLPIWLAPGGLALFEIDETQGKAVSQLAREMFPRADIVVKQDLTRRDRFLWIQT